MLELVVCYCGGFFQRFFLLQKVFSSGFFPWVVLGLHHPKCFCVYLGPQLVLVYLYRFVVGYLLSRVFVVCIGAKRNYIVLWRAQQALPQCVIVGGEFACKCACSGGSLFVYRTPKV